MVGAASGNRTEEDLVAGGATRPMPTPMWQGPIASTISIGTALSSEASLTAAGNVVAETRSGTTYGYRHNQNGRLSEVDVNGTPTATISIAQAVVGIIIVGGVMTFEAVEEFLHPPPLPPPRPGTGFNIHIDLK
jgi:YD repeat-containing protein